MSIFYPDNGNRKNRLIELSSDAQRFLTESKQSFDQYRSLIDQLNDEIAKLYQQAGLTPPKTRQVDILKEKGVADDVDTSSTAIEVSEIVIDVGGFVATSLYLAPAITSVLVDTGVIAAETAGTVLASCLGVEITVGGLAGGIIGGLIGAAIIAGIGLAIDAISGAIIRSKLRDGIAQLDQTRARLLFAQKKIEPVIQSMQGAIDAMRALSQDGIPITEQMIQNIIQRTIQPGIEHAQALPFADILSRLSDLDRSRNSWTNEDVTPTPPDEQVQPVASAPPASESSSDEITPDEIAGPAGEPLPAEEVEQLKNIDAIPTYMIKKVPRVLAPQIPESLKLADHLSSDVAHHGAYYPVLWSKEFTYWPLVRADQSRGLILLAFDAKGQPVQDWERSKLSSVIDIISDPHNNRILFQGVDKDVTTFAWNELTLA